MAARLLGLPDAATKRADVVVGSWACGGDAITTPSPVGIAMAVVRFDCSSVLLVQRIGHLHHDVMADLLR